MHDARSPQQRLDLGRHRSMRREHGVELVAVLHEVVRHRHDDLALQVLGVLLHGRDGRVGVHREDHDRRVARPCVVARVQPRHPVAPPGRAAPSTACTAFSVEREPNNTSCPTLASRAASHHPRDPSPPKSQSASGDRICSVLRMAHGRVVLVTGVMAAGSRPLRSCSPSGSSGRRTYVAIGTVR